MAALTHCERREAREGDDTVKRGKKKRARLKPYSPDVGGGRYPFVAIVGRPNVGKSTLFNRFVGQRLAIEEPTAGTTRDRLAALVPLDDGRALEMCDMGGLGGTGDVFDEDVNLQIDLAIEYADMVLFLVDSRDGLTPADEKIGRRLQKTGKPVVVAANKAETAQLEIMAAEFYSLGFPTEVFPVSAREGVGKSELLEAIVRVLEEHDLFAVREEADDDDEGDLDGDDADDLDGDDAGDLDGDDAGDLDGDDAGDLDGDDADDLEGDDADDLEGDDDAPLNEDDDPDAEFMDDPGEGTPIRTLKPKHPMRLAIVGRRNVGKSTFVNAVLGEERVIASSRPGTTRDAIDVKVEVEGKELILIDTAGLRKRGRADDQIELISHGRTRLAVQRCDAALLFLDCLADVRNLDKRVAGMIASEHKACVIVANKWDLTDDRMTPEEFADYIGKLLPNLRYAPVVAISALEKQNAEAPIVVAQELFEQSMIQIGTGRLNRALSAAIQLRRPRPYRNLIGKVFFGTQIATNPVTILLFVNNPELFPPSYRRYLGNQLRKTTPWEEIPIKLVFRARESLYRKGGGLAARVRRMHALSDEARWVENQPTENVRAIEDTLDLEEVQAVLLDTFNHDDRDEDPHVGLEEGGE